MNYIKSFPVGSLWHFHREFHCVVLTLMFFRCLGSLSSPHPSTGCVEHVGMVRSVFLSLARCWNCRQILQHLVVLYNKVFSVCTLTTSLFHVDCIWIYCLHVHICSLDLFNSALMILLLLCLLVGIKPRQALQQ